MDQTSRFCVLRSHARPLYGAMQSVTCYLLPFPADAGCPALHIQSHCRVAALASPSRSSSTDSPRAGDVCRARGAARPTANDRPLGARAPYATPHSLRGSPRNMRATWRRAVAWLALRAPLRRCAADGAVVESSAAGEQACGCLRRPVNVKPTMKKCR